MNKKEECWSELFEIWLKSIGATDMDTMAYGYGFFIYNTIKYKWSFWAPIRPLKIDIGYDSTWANLSLKLENVDIYDPSFDPDAFFEPFKEWLLEAKSI